MTRRLPFPLLLLAATAAPLARPLPAAAQQPRDTVALDSLTVTVLRGTVDPRVSPYAVTVLDARELGRGRAPAFFEDALEAIPGVQVQNRFNFAQGERIAVRGYGARAQFGVRGVKLIVDGIPATLPDGQSNLDVVDLPSLGRVEVLRGAGSALYGNAAGGVLAFSSMAPPPERFAPDLRLSGGSHGLRTGDARVAGTVGRAGYLVSASRLEWDGFRTLAADSTKTYGAADRKALNARLILPAGPGTLRATAVAMDQFGESPGSLPQGLFDAGSSQAWPNDVRQHSSKDSSQQQLGLDWTGPLAGVDADVSAWGLHRDTDNPIATSIVDLRRNGGGARAVLRGSRPAWSWDAGGSLELQSDARKNYANAQGQRGGLSLDQHESVLAGGLFAQGRARPFERAELLAALRWDRFRFHADDHFRTNDPDDSGTRVMSALDPSAAFSWAAREEAVLFGSVSTSLETPTTTELVNRPSGAGGFNPDLEPSRGVSVEAGVRGGRGARVRWELVGFRSWLRHELVPFEVPQAAGRTFYRNAGSSRHTGLEASLDVQPIDALRLRVSHTRTNARFRAYVVRGVDLSGKRVPGVGPARWEGVLTLQGGPAFVELSGERMAPLPADDANTAWTPEHTLFDLRAGLDRLGIGGLRVSPFAAVTNLTDRRYASSVVVNATGSRFFEPGPRRSVQVGLSTGWR